MLIVEDAVFQRAGGLFVERWRLHYENTHVAPD